MFAMQGFPAGTVVHLALGTSMATIVDLGIEPARHHAHGAVRWDIVRRIAPGGSGGYLSRDVCRLVGADAAAGVFFACFMAYVSVQMILNVKPKPSAVTCPGRWAWRAWARASAIWWSPLAAARCRCLS